MSPAAFGALTLRCVRLVSPEAPGWREMIPTGAPYSRWALSLDGGVCISDPIIAICHNFTFRKADTMPLCVQLNYSIRKTFVNGFEQNLRHPDADDAADGAILGKDQGVVGASSRPARR